MKRNEALAQLSREHHQSLFVVLRMKQATEGTIPETMELLRGHWNDHAKLHFDIEDDVLLPAFLASAGKDDPMVKRVEKEHGRLREDILALINDPSPSLARIGEVAEALQTHVRFEEREFFPHCEKVMPESALLEVAAAVERAEQEA